MKFRTEIELRPYARQLSHADRLLALGSCFTETIGERLADARFRITINPSGVLFNPLSILRTLERYDRAAKVSADELHHADGRWFHYDFHGKLADTTPEKTLARLNEAVDAGAEALHAANVVLITLGTAWIFERCDTGEVVANCHRQPAELFHRRRLTVEEVVAALETALRGPLQGKLVLLTVSPVRHLGDGLTGNAVSKATLRLAVEELTLRHPDTILYFPAYEMLNDDLRDYRFYADDLVHPSQQAVAYIWERFVETLLTPDTQRLLPCIARIVAASRHRPLVAASSAYRDFCRHQLEEIKRLPQIDFSEESTFFQRQIEINS